FTAIPGTRPATTPLARLQATEGTQVTNMRGETITLDEIHRQVLRHLDGTRDQALLREDLVAHLKQGGHALRPDDDHTPAPGEAEMRRVLHPALGKALQNLAKLALLVRPHRP